MKFPFAAARGLALFGCLSAVLSAQQVLMLDFGPTAASGASLSNSPYHTVNPSAGTSWNTLGVADVSSGLVWADGSAVSGISLNLGATTAAGTTLGLGNTPSNGTGLTGTTMNGGVYANTSPGRDGIFTGTTGNERAVGLQIGGLVAGTYTIYITGRNTNTAAGHVQNFYAGVSASSGDFNFVAAGYQSKALTYFAAPTLQNDAWSTGSLANYAVFNVTITGGDYLNLAVKGGTGELRGFLNSVQIVSAVPEPSAAATLAGVAALAGVALRRRRRG